MVDTKDLYGSGLNRTDWHFLASIIDAHLNSKDPNTIPPPIIPEHLREHPVAKSINEFRQTKDLEYLIAAGQPLTPGSSGWYLAITKR